MASSYVHSNFDLMFQYKTVNLTNFDRQGPPISEELYWSRKIV